MTVSFGDIELFKVATEVFKKAVYNVIFFSCKSNYLILKPWVMISLSQINDSSCDWPTLVTPTVLVGG